MKFVHLELGMNMLKKCLRYNLPLMLNTTPDTITNKLYTHSLQGLANYAKQYIKMYAHQSIAIYAKKHDLNKSRSIIIMKIIYY